ncbi:hypothetical protein ACLKA6_010659 [Drosophila palustris]
MTRLISQVELRPDGKSQARFRRLCPVAVQLSILSSATNFHTPLWLSECRCRRYKIFLTVASTPLCICLVWLVPACRLAIDMMILGTNFWSAVVVSSWSNSRGSRRRGLDSIPAAPCACFVHVIDNNN